MVATSAIIVKSGNVNATQAIDLNLLILTDNITADDFSTIESNLRSEMDSILKSHNLQTGTINFTIGSDSQKQRYASNFFPESDLVHSSLLDLCGLMASTVGSNRALNVAFVDDVGDEGTAGISVGLPGSPMVDGSPISCVVAALQGNTDFANNTQGINILHEGSHLMGMTHTTESEGTYFDLFNDTPECRANQFDTNNDGIVDDAECASQDGRNYMFWSEGGLNMSSAQAWTLRRHPLFYPATSTPSPTPTPAPSPTPPPSGGTSDSLEAAIDANDNGVIDDEEIKTAIQIWVLGDTVPGTDGMTISDESIMSLITLWVTGAAIA
jgi:hypothetical protein